MKRRIWALVVIGCAMLGLPGEPANGQGATLDEPTIVEIDYFERFVMDGGLITWLILIPGSITTGALVMQGFMAIRRSAMIPESLQTQVQELFDKREFREAVELTAGEPSLLGQVMHAALNEASGGYAAMQEAIVDASDDHATRMRRQIEHLNLIGNVSPMVGLFGTVFGMIEAFNAIVAMGGAPEPAKLAEGISIALVTTFWGLLVAIPALTFFSLLRNRMDGLVEECGRVAEELLTVFRPGEAEGDS